LNEYGTLIENIFVQYDSHNIPALKAAVHKIKPIFGFVGLISMQHQCQQFEDNCQPSSPFDMLVNNYNALKNNLISSKSIIEEEKRKLELFNSQ
jgi:HPt (histidine-containing phosphotransfer) domain-containing protein